ncbi:MAG: hypothetical protein HQK49_00890 [Oligoflexia bacterium]|nr:hypothetical protein [Oligoflexia bacterium]
MKDINLRVEGIYDVRTIQFLKSIGINCYSFDFRPRSFNFLQQYKFLQILSEEYNKDMHCFLRYENERDFVIQKMLDDLRELFPLFPLEFSDDLGRKYYDGFKHPYWWHYRESNELNSLLESEYLEGIVIDADMFGQYLSREAILSFLQIFYVRSSERYEQQGPLKLIIRAQWQNLKKLLANFDSDHVKVEYASLPIDQSIEVCYRNVDLNKLRKNCENINK